MKICKKPLLLGRCALQTVSTDMLRLVKIEKSISSWKFDQDPIFSRENATVPAWHFCARKMEGNEMLPVNIDRSNKFSSLLLRFAEICFPSIFFLAVQRVLRFWFSAKADDAGHALCAIVFVLRLRFCGVFHGLTHLKYRPESWPIHPGSRSRFFLTQSMMRSVASAS